MNTIQTIYGSLAATLVVVACGSSDQSAPVANTPVSETVVTSQNTADKTVVQRLATARCDQEQTCNNIGAGQKFASREVCMDSLRGNIGNDLNGYKCPSGLDSAAVDRCLSAIQSEECSHPFDTLTRFDKCRTSAICMK